MGTLLTAVAIVVACQEARLQTQSIVLVVDLSASATPEVKTQYAAWAASLLAADSVGTELLGPGDVLFLLRVTDASTTQADVPRVELPAFDPERENLDVARLRARRLLNGSRSRVDAFFAEASRAAAPRSQIAGAIRLAGDLLRGGAHPRRTLIVFSDMIEESERLDFARRPPIGEAALRLVEAERAAGRVPDLAGVRVIVAGAGAGAYARRLSDDQLDGIRRFWLAYFRAAGADLTAERYLPTFVGL